MFRKFWKWSYFYASCGTWTNLVVHILNNCFKERFARKCMNKNLNCWESLFFVPWYTKDIEICLSSIRAPLQICVCLKKGCWEILENSLFHRGYADKCVFQFNVDLLLKSIFQKSKRLKVFLWICRSCRAHRIADIFRSLYQDCI